ncbi:MAG: hypothetical protein QOD63_1439, partial [Actinomycetota bacterium]|nr:hypothetical protein [Actinomycetota bacterium]
RKLRKLDGVPDQWVAQWAAERRDHPSGENLPPRQRRLSDDR